MAVQAVHFFLLPRKKSFREPSGTWLKLENVSFHHLFPFQVYLDYSYESLMRWQKASVTALDGGEEQIKD